MPYFDDDDNERQPKNKSFLGVAGDFLWTAIKWAAIAILTVATLGTIFHFNKTSRDLLDGVTGGVGKGWGTAIDEYVVGKKTSVINGIKSVFPKAGESIDNALNSTAEFIDPQKKSLAENKGMENVAGVTAAAATLVAANTLRAKGNVDKLTGEFNVLTKDEAKLAKEAAEELKKTKARLIKLEEVKVKVTKDAEKAVKAAEEMAEKAKAAKNAGKSAKEVEELAKKAIELAKKSVEPINKLAKIEGAIHDSTTLINTAEKTTTRGAALIDPLAKSNFLKASLMGTVKVAGAFGALFTGINGAVHTSKLWEHTDENGNYDARDSAVMQATGATAETAGYVASIFNPIAALLGAGANDWLYVADAGRNKGKSNMNRSGIAEVAAAVLPVDWVMEHGLGRVLMETGKAYDYVTGNSGGDAPTQNNIPNLNKSNDNNIGRK